MCNFRTICIRDAVIRVDLDKHRAIKDDFKWFKANRKRTVRVRLGTESDEYLFIKTEGESYSNLSVRGEPNPFVIVEKAGPSFRYHTTRLLPQVHDQLKIVMASCDANNEKRIREAIDRGIKQGFDALTFSSALYVNCGVNTHRTSMKRGRHE